MKDSINDEFIDRLRLESDIVNIISGYIPLQKKGRNFWGCCPFHNEKTPSFSVTPDKGFFYCFGCQTGGNVFNFLMKIENINFFDSVKLLAHKMNIAIPEKAKSEGELAKERELASLYRINELARDFFHACLLKTSLGKSAREYLAGRGVTDELIRAFKIGFAPPAWDKLVTTFAERNFNGSVLVKAGLAVPRSHGGGVYDRFRNRIIFPIGDARGRTIGFGGRVLDNTNPKYLNSPETLLFNKRTVLYGLDNAYTHIRESGQAIIVEGYMDLIAAYNAGVKNVVASLGTAFTPAQARQLLHYGNELIFAYDNDAAGQSATLRAMATVRTMGAVVKVITIPDGKDPDEFIRKHGAEKFRTLASQAPSLLDYQISQAVKSADYSSLDGKVAIIAKAIPALAVSDNAVEVNAYISSLSQMLAVDESSIRSELRKYIRTNQKDKNVNLGKNRTAMVLSAPNQAIASAEQNIIRVMFEHSEYIPTVQAQLSPEDIQSNSRREIMISIFNAYNMGKNILPSALSTKLSNDANTELSNIMLINSDFGDVARVINDCIKLIRITRLKALYEQHRLRADELQRMGDSRFLQELAESQRINDEINKLHQI